VLVGVLVGNGVEVVPPLAVVAVGLIVGLAVGDDEEVAVAVGMDVRVGVGVAQSTVKASVATSSRFGGKWVASNTAVVTGPQVASVLTLNRAAAEYVPDV
jgi:hypothetical protein